MHTTVQGITLHGLTRNCGRSTARSVGTLVASGGGYLPKQKNKTQFLILKYSRPVETFIEQSSLLTTHEAGLYFRKAERRISTDYTSHIVQASRQVNGGIFYIKEGARAEFLSDVNVDGGVVDTGVTDSADVTPDAGRGGCFYNEVRENATSFSGELSALPGAWLQPFTPPTWHHVVFLIVLKSGRLPSATVFAVESWWR